MDFNLILYLFKPLNNKIIVLLTFAKHLNNQSKEPKSKSKLMTIQLKQ